MKFLVEKYKSLLGLKLAANKVATLEECKVFGEFKELFKLDLVDNPVCKVAGYRDELFKMIPSLHVLDG